MAGDPRDRPVTARDLSAAVIVILSGLFLTSFTILGALFLTWTPVGEFTFFLVVSVAFLGVFAGWSVYLDAGERRWSTARGRASLPPGGSARPGSTLPDGSGVAAFRAEHRAGNDGSLPLRIQGRPCGTALRGGCDRAEARSSGRETSVRGNSRG